MNNPIQFVQAMRNPQVFMQQIMNNNQVNQNPMARNALEMFQKGDSKGLEELARNLCTEKGVKPEDVFKQIKSQFGM
jgi:formate dehydrogenase maturation protein FdhE